MSANSLVIIGTSTRVFGIGTHVDQYGNALAGDIPCRSDQSPYTPTRANSLPGGSNGTLGTSLYPFKNIHLEPGGQVYSGNTVLDATTGIINEKYGFIPSNSLYDFNVKELSTGSEANLVHVYEGVGGKFYGSDGAIYTGVTSTSIVSLPAASGSYPRWDLIALDASAGSYVVTTGAASPVSVMPSIPAGQDALAYVYRPTSVNTITNNLIYNVRTPIISKNTDGHYKTNFSINQKEDSEDTEFELQQYFQNIDYGLSFDTVIPSKTKLRTVDIFHCRADNTGEITYTGSWSNDDSTNYKFGRVKTSSTAGDTAVFSFFGTGIAVAVVEFTLEGFFFAEISDDGGSTYKRKMTITNDSNSTTSYGTVYELYKNLPIGEYKVKITVGRSSRILIEYFSYMVHVIQRPCSVFACKNGSGGTAADVNAIPPATFLLTGTWGAAKNSVTTQAWNSTYMQTATATDYFEFVFYGSKIWINIFTSTDQDNDIDFLIDGVNTNVRNTSGFNADTPGNTLGMWLRIDNGSLAEGWHTLKVTATSITGGNYFTFSGAAFYSAECPTTICRSLISGQDSYLVGADDSGLTYSGTWAGVTDNASALLRRSNSTTANAAYVQMTTPNNVNLKAIYMVGKIDNSTIGAELAVTLASGNTRYIDTQANGYEQGSFIWLLYDKFRDQVNLHNVALRVAHNDTGASTAFTFEGFIFEIGDECETTFIKVMPKFTRYNNSTAGIIGPISNTYRLDIYGVKSDQSDGNQPMIHTAWLNGNFNANLYHSTGVWYSDIISAMLHVASNGVASLNYGGSYLASVSASHLGGFGVYAPGMNFKVAGSSGSNSWQKIIYTLKGVV